MIPTLTLDRFGEAIMESLNNEIAKIIEEEAKLAGERTEERVRKLIPAVAASLFQNYSMERLGPDLVIRIQHERKP